MELTFVTGNAGKMHEARILLGDTIRVQQDTGGYIEIQADTLEEVAMHGLNTLMKRLDPPYFLEDSGLFIDALGGFPGVYSAYALKTIGWRGILRLMEDVPDDKRTARFSAVVAHRDEAGNDRLFRGDVEGTIAQAGRGDNGFGFDPIFVATGHERTFGEMHTDEKTALSHRGVAMRALRAHLQGALQEMLLDPQDEDPDSLPAFAEEP